MIVYVVIVGMGIWLAQNRADATPSGPDYERMAKVLGQEVIKQALKHPLDATFSNMLAYRDVAGHWVACDHVKPPNGFGLPLTSKWFVEFTEKGERLSVAEVTMGGKLICTAAESAKQIANSP